MTNTNLSVLSQIPSRDHPTSLVDQIVQSITHRIKQKLLRNGARMPSIRQFADSQQVSRFTVVEAYDRLVAAGLLESRRGSGFYVRERQTLRPSTRNAAAPPPQLDVGWLVRSMFREHPMQAMPGAGMLPNDWLDGELVASALRAISRQNQNLLLQYGIPHGFLPLRQQLQLKLTELEISATPEQIVTTAGVTQALDLVARHFTQPGDTIFVDDPAWFLMFGSFVTLGARVIGIPRLSDGPDIQQLAELAALHRPKLYVLNSVLHNPTSSSLSAAKAFQILKLAEQHEFLIVEDDIYCDMHPGGAVQSATRIATLDQLQRVIYLGGFSKTLAANLRVGFIATSPAIAQQLADRKMLTSLTSSEIGERVVYKILSGGQYRKHLDRLRHQLDRARDKALRQLERAGFRIPYSAPTGMFAWVDCGFDTSRLAEIGIQQNVLFAPGSLFSPTQLPSTFTRINIASMQNPAVLKILQLASN